MNPSLFVIAGEMSGDTHAAALLDALRKTHPDLKIGGAGGPKIQKVAGPSVRDWLDQSAVMGIIEVLKHYRFFKQSFDSLLAEAIDMQPDVLLLVDYPGFNLRFAAAVRRALPDTRIIQYVCPQVWAWKKGRIKKMATLYDEILCLLPFEPELFSRTGPAARFVGHPLVDELEAARIPAIPREDKLVALIPGSRGPEIDKLFPIMLDTASRLHQVDPSLHFEVPAANRSMRAKIDAHLKKNSFKGSLRVLDGGAHALMQRAQCGLVTSGTATVEAAYYGLPYCIVYKLAWPTYLIARMVVSIKFIGLINILAKEEVVEEFIQSDADPCHLARAIQHFLDNPEKVAELQQKMTNTIQQLGPTGAHQRAANAVSEWFKA